MKAPDKLYLSPVIYGTITNISPNPDCEGEVEYVRKDALLKWIQEARAIPHENAIVRDLTFQEVVNKLDSL